MILAGERSLPLLMTASAFMLGLSWPIGIYLAQIRIRLDNVEGGWEVPRDAAV